ncbi:MAG: hypothetical protein MMC23_002952 [Stictis urceolatum]|nr:hypothetical protein [Stictis urceolata]
MEGHHGVDISWLHHTHKDHHGSKDVAASPSTQSTGDKLHNGQAQSRTVTNAAPLGGAAEVRANGESPMQEQANGSRPLNHKRSSELSGKGGKPAAPPGISRKGSWISNISSKFSSSSQQNSPTQPPVQTRPAAAEMKKEQGPAQTGSLVAKDLKKSEPSPPTASSPGKSPGFLTSALRRLSSSAGSGNSKVAGTGGVCPRRVMNVDPYRERCQIDDLQPAKLRRVSFCVDVEIAAPVRYTEDEHDYSSSPPGRRPSLSQLEKAADAKKAKEKNVKMKEQAEGEALKRPETVASEKEEQGGDIEAVDESIEPTANPATESETKDAKDMNGETTQGTTRKKEKKKRSEEERKERKERKRQAAIANGSIPIEITLSEDSSECSTPTMNPQRERRQSHPTTDPLRIYRRCCQLRETPVLKRITDQLSQPSICDAGQDAIVSCLDLTSFRMPLSDVVTFSDYLAVVPVRKLIMEDCDLTDEGVRVILAGLLAAKTPDQAKFNKHLSKQNDDETTSTRTERVGVIEKLSLKNNPKVGRDGWTHVALFIHMSRSLKAIDLSMIPLPPGPDSTSSGDHRVLHHKQNGKKSSANVCSVLTKCLTGRLSGSRLEEVVMAQCGLQTDHVEKIVSAITACGVTRLGLASNNLSIEALQSVATYVATGQCEGLDLGGNDLSEHLNILIDAFSNENNSMYALSLADCNLTPAALKILFPALIRLENFKFIDLSHNRALFAARPNAIFLLRKYLPQMHALKRIHLNDVAMDSEHCIALAEILPEIPYLAHVGISDNPQLTILASAKDEATAEEACAFYASLMAAVRVSMSIVSLDVDMPTSESSELVQALGKQILAYALRNMERGPAAETIGLGDRHQSVVEVPDILMHLIGHSDDSPENHDSDEPAPNEDYIVSGTGVAKALSICLGNTSLDRRRPSRDVTPMGRGSGSVSGATTPKKLPGEVTELKPKNMSRNLLDSARKIRARLQPALAREAKFGDEMSFSAWPLSVLRPHPTNNPPEKLQFLDSTLSRMIERFEDEYPECRPKPPPSPTETPSSESGSLENSTTFSDPFRGGPASQDTEPDDLDADVDADAALDEESSPSDPSLKPKPRLSRHGSDVSLASRHLNNEEAQMHRFGQQMRRSILAPQTFDHVHQASGEEEARHLQALRAKLEMMTGEQIKEKVRDRGVERVLEEMGSNARELLLLEKEDPEGFEKFREAQGNAGASALEKGSG